MFLRVFINNNQEFRVVALLLIAVLGIEMTLRLSEKHLSDNIFHIFSIPSILDKVGSNKNNSIVFIGNSLTNRGIDSSIINDVLNKNGHSAYQAFKIIPDNSGIAEWYCIYQNQIRQLSKPPKTIAVGFAWDQISDQSLIKPARLGGLFCRKTDIQPLSVTDLGHHVKQLQYYAGMVSHVYVNREAVRNRVLEPFIPNYLGITRKINENNNKITRHSEQSEIRYTYALLGSLVENIRATGSNIVLIAMPVMRLYELDTSLLEFAGKLGLPLLDMRNTGLIDNHMYMDPIHLNPDGRKILSDLVAQELRTLLEMNRTTDSGKVAPGHMGK